MIKKNLQKSLRKNVHKKFLIVACVTLSILMLATACGKKKKIPYGDIPGTVTGSIDVSGKDAKLDIDNVIAPVGADIDYTSNLASKGAGPDYSLEVNASNVRTNKPGTYNVEYKVKSNGKTYTDNVKVTITDDEDVTIPQNNNSANNGSESQGNNVPVNNGGNGGASQNNGENENKHLDPGDSANSYKNTSIPNAVIELLNGDVVTISCSTDNYIVATRTDTSTVNKNGSNYKILKLVVVFNTGKEQTLDTLEKKID